MVNLVYDFFGNKIQIIVPQSLVPQDFLDYWNALYCPKNSSSVKAVFHIIRLRGRSTQTELGTFCNNQLLCYQDRRCNIHCRFDSNPIKIRILIFDQPNLKHLFFSVYLFALSNILKRMGIVWFHAGSISKNGKGVLISAGTRGGKTTSVISLIRRGFDFVTDDVAFVQNRGGRIQVLGFEKDLSLLKESISFFPELEFLKHRPFVKKGTRWKKVLRVNEISCLNGAQKVKSSEIKAILFPKLVRGTKTRLTPLSKAETFLKVIETQHQELKVVVDDPFAIRKQFKVYQAVAEKTKGYELLLNKNVEEIPVVVNSIL